VTFRSYSTQQETAYAGTQATATSTTIAKPAGTVQGDILAVCIAIDIASGIRAPLVAKPLDPSWVTVANSNSSSVAGLMHVFWKVAGASEPSSYTFEFRQSTTTGLLSPAFSSAIMGCWTDWTSAVLKVFSGANRFSNTGSINTSCPPNPPHVIDIDSVTLDGAETTTGGIQIAFWLNWSGIENFQGVKVWSDPNPVYPATIPWNTASVDSPQVQHAQIHYEGLPTYFGGELVTTTLADNKMLTLASHDVTAGTLPDVSGQFTWQHAGAEAGYGETVQVFRFVVEAVAVVQAYWGILHQDIIP